MERQTLIERIVSLAENGDAVLVMGARDDTLTDLCRGIATALEAGGASHV